MLNILCQSLAFRLTGFLFQIVGLVAIDVFGFEEGELVEFFGANLLAFFK
jgi:hypothetical protein